MTIFQKSIIEHNMIATSRIYLNIQLSELSAILRVSTVHQTIQVCMLLCVVKIV